ncbi:N-acetylmuramoyl-L-alanine amidase family protein [Megamonas funiformis]|uniref:N-acetylmuramoyl-L-alanine amidase family protein n=1 Tax=Megamonas funiformis TaxID=437897 RepID=UPI00033F0DC4|nr:N-acetylmuramoyl-L-alanine amidase [Megamonas funiformis]CDB98189.1 n-acetylmuramoyl-L-alanine amidase CwlD [Megamonas funiformis CAG:377]
MYNLLKKVILCSVVLLLMVIPNISLAKSSVNVEKISHNLMTSEQGDTYLHIEINTNREVKNFSIQENPNNKYQLIFNIEDAQISNISRQEKLDGNIAKKVFLQEKKDTVQGKIYLQEEVNNNYKIYSLGKKGIAIDIFNSVVNTPVVSDVALSNVKNKIITIDPGHGGSDSGAVGHNGYTEKEGAFAISQKVASILNQSGAKVVMTRDSDVDVYGPNASARNELQARVDVGNNANSDIFVSIHCNAFVNPAANGTQTFYYGSSYQGQRLAQSIQEKMIEANGLRNRGISTCNFYVVKHSYMPAVLIETAFITNYDEEALLSDDEWQTTMAKAIAEGINEYFSN